MPGKGLSTAEIKKLPKIANWESTSRRCCYYKGEGLSVYMICKEKIKNSNSGIPNEHICYITLFQGDGSFLLYFRRKGAAHQIIPAGKTKVLAIDSLIEKIHSETRVTSACKEVGTEALSTALNVLKKSLIKE